MNKYNATIESLNPFFIRSVIQIHKAQKLASDALVLIPSL